MRLTRRIKNRYGIDTGVVCYESITGNYLFPKRNKEKEAIDKLAAYEDAEEQGRLVPVRHGKWTPDKEGVEWGNSLIRYKCSECRGRPHFDKEKYRFILSPYCPNCGARMDGE